MANLRSAMCSAKLWKHAIESALCDSIDQNTMQETMRPPKRDAVFVIAILRPPFATCVYLRDLTLMLEAERPHAV